MTELRSELDLFEHDAQELEQNLEVLYSRRACIREWAKAWKTYYTNTITEESIAEWILQHVQPPAVLEALRILECVRFVPETELAKLLRDLFSALPTPVQNVGRFFAAGGLHDSTAPVGYAFGKWLGLKEADFAARQVKSLESLTDADTSLILLDDNIASGTQLVDTLRGWMGESSTSEIGQPLTPAASSRLRRIELHWLHAFALSDGDQRAESQAREFGINLRVHVAQRLPFSVFDGLDKGAAERTRRRLSSIGWLLTSDKGWPPSLQMERLVGHGNLARGVVFSHNVPKNLLTTLWKFGRLSHGNWTPLFPEREEWRLHERAIVIGNPYLRVLGRKVLDGLTAKKHSLITATMRVNGAEEDDSTVSLTAVEDVYRAYVPDWLKVLRVGHTTHADFEARNERLRGTKHLGLLGGTFQPVTKEMADAYNQRVDEYNNELERYAEELRDALISATRVVELRFDLANTGTVFAKKIRVELTLPPGEMQHHRALYLPAPPKPPAKPEPRYRHRHDEFLAIGNPLASQDYTRTISALGRAMDRSEWKPYVDRLADGRQKFIWQIEEFRQGSERQLLKCVYRLASESGLQQILWEVHSEDMPASTVRSMSVTLVRGTRASNEVVEAIARLTGRERELAIPTEAE